MGGKETSGSAYSPPRAPRPPRAPIPRPPLQGRFTDLSRWREPFRLANLDRWVRTSPVVDWLYLLGVLAVPLLAAYILAYG
jgi:hypothetical protein